MFIKYRLLVDTLDPLLLFRSFTVLILFMIFCANFESLFDSGYTIPFITLLTIFFLYVLQKKTGSLSLLTSKRWNRLSFFLFLIFLFSSLYWAKLFDSSQISDFGVYLRCGLSVNSSMIEWLENCQSAYLEPSNIYWVRSFFYSSWIVRFFGDEYITFKIINAFLHIITIVIWFFGIRHYYGPRVALISSLIFSIYPEYFFTTTLVTPDNAVLLFIALFIVLTPKLDSKNKSKLFIAVTLGVCVFFTHQLRTLGPIFIVSSFLYLFFSKKNVSLSIFLFSIIFFVYVALSNLFIFLFPTDFPQFFSPLKTLFSIDFFTTQDFSVNYLWSEHFWSNLPKERQLETVLYKITNELNYGFSRIPTYLFDKAKVVFSGSGYYGLSSFNYPPGNPDSSLDVSMTTIPFIHSLYPWLTSFVCIFILMSVFSLFKNNIGDVGFISMVVLGSFFLVVLGVGEAQSRYSILIVPSLSLLSAIALFPNDRMVSNENKIRLINDFNVLKFFRSCLFMFFIYCFLTIIFLSIRQRYNITERIELISTSDSILLGCSNNGIEIEQSHKRLRVEFNIGSPCAVIKIPLKNGIKNISFFVSGSRFPFPFENKFKSPFNYRAFSRNNIYLIDSLKFDTVHWHEIKTHSENEKEIMIFINNSDISTKDYLDFSLLNGIE